MLRSGGQPLVQEELVSEDEELVTLEVRPPAPHGLDQADELLLVRRQLVVAGDEWSAEEGQRLCPLVENGAKLVPQASQSTMNY